MLRGAEVACAAAGVVARANDVVVSGCRADGQDLLVEVTAEVAGSLGGSAVGRARAGPVTSIEGAALPAPRAGDGVDAVPRGVRRVVPAR
jgi:hypothetical protein